MQSESHIQAWPDLFIVDWLSRQNHSKKKNKEILGMWLSINATQSTTNIPECMTIHAYSVSLSRSYKGGMKAKTNYHKTSEHTGHSETMWQLSME